MAPARTVLDKTENERTGRRRIRMASARAILDKQKTNVIRMAPARTILDQTENERKAEGEFGWLRPGPFLTNTEEKTNEKAKGEFGWLRPGPS